MHFFQSQLYADHYNLLRLLKLLDDEVACYQDDLGNHARLDVILSIFDYVQTYPEKWHHPIENAAFELLLVKQVPHSDQIWSLKSEHKKLEKLTREANQLFNNVANDIIVSADELVKTTREFIHRQREHIAIENKLIYPLLEKYISDQEWEEMADSIKERKNAPTEYPHAKAVENKIEYQDLLRVILKTEYGNALGAAARGISVPRRITV